MKGLLLVDLDNVQGVSLSFLVSRCLAAQKACEGVSCWEVVWAFNTTTVSDIDATKNPFTFASLSEAGAALGATSHLAMTLTMPQAADVMVARLARESLDADAYDYAAAILVSRDRDLADSLHVELFGERAWRRVTKDFVHCWRMPEGGKMVRRKPAPSTRTNDGRAPELARECSVLIDSHESAAWAASRALDVEAGLSLSELALQVEREPWLLSQLGGTFARKKSLRGVGRLARFGAGDALVLGAVSKDEGVEVRGAAVLTSGTRPGNASVGIGAVRFEGGTVASRISSKVLEDGAVERGCRVSQDGVSVRSALQMLPTDTLLGSNVTVKLKAVDGWVVAKVEHESRTQPSAWWILGETTTKSEVNALDGDRLPAEISVKAQSLVPSSDVGAYISRPRRDVPELKRALMVLASAAGEGDEVTVTSAIAAGEIGEASFQPEHGKAKTVALLALHGRPFSAGEKVRVCPIHLAQPRGVAESLWALPLVVPA